jgi:hypothetical protein
MRSASPVAICVGRWIQPVTTTIRLGLRLIAGLSEPSKKTGGTRAPGSASSFPFPLQLLSSPTPTPVTTE